MITDAQILSSKAEIIEKNEQYWTSSPLRSRRGKDTEQRGPFDRPRKGGWGRD